MRLSVCLIVKNEARHLADCLASIQEIADEVIVVDTGSEDESAAIAQGFGARLFFEKWNDDFSAARNFALRQALGQWILLIDADERLDPSSVPAIKHILESAANGVLLQSQFHSIVHTSVARRNLQNFAKHIDLGNQIPPQCQNLIDDGSDVNKCRQLHQLLENVLKPYWRILNGQAKTLSASNALNFIKTNPQLAVSVLKDPNTAIAASATLAQILLPLYQWKGAPNVEVRMPNTPKTYRWSGQNFGNVSRLYQTAPVSSIRTQNTAQIKANFKPIYATQEKLSLADLCKEARAVMNQYGN